MKQKRDQFGVKGWRVSWTDAIIDVRVSNVYYSRTRSSAKRRAERENSGCYDFRVGPYCGGVEVPDFHAALA